MLELMEDRLHAPTLTFNSQLAISKVFSQYQSFAILMNLPESTQRKRHGVHLALFRLLEEENPIKPEHTVTGEHVSADSKKEFIRKHSAGLTPGNFDVSPGYNPPTHTHTHLQ